MSGLPVLLFLDISGGELLVIMLVVFLVFGPDKMPDMARKAGRLMNQMKKASNDLTREFKKETSELQNEINTVKSKVNEQVESVNREFNRTKAGITNEMKTESKPLPNSDSESTDEVTVSETLKPTEPTEPATNTIIIE
jgi:sec-independent protein translocase protein TatA